MSYNFTREKNASVGSKLKRNFSCLPLFQTNNHGFLQRLDLMEFVFMIYDQDSGAHTCWDDHCE